MSPNMPDEAIITEEQLQQLGTEEETKEGTAKIEAWISASSNVTMDTRDVIDTGIPLSEWSAMSEDQKEEAVKDDLMTFLWNDIDLGWCELGRGKLSEEDI